jgi:hypothetical protein
VLERREGRARKEGMSEEERRRREEIYKRGGERGASVFYTCIKDGRGERQMERRGTDRIERSKAGGNKDSPYRFLHSFENPWRT